MQSVAEPRGVLVLGHGAGGGVAAPDLVAVTRAACPEGVEVVLVEQPYRVAGRRSPPPAAQLDLAWVDVVEQLRADEFGALPLIVGGRSSGARVACRTAEAVDAVGVLCLAFPLQPPRRTGAAAAASRLPELELVRVPTLVVQGERGSVRDPAGREAQEGRAGGVRSRPEVRPRCGSRCRSRLARRRPRTFCFSLNQ